MPAIPARCSSRRRSCPRRTCRGPAGRRTPPPTKLSPRRIRPANSGWSTSMPESMMATRTGAQVGAVRARSRTRGSRRGTTAWRASGSFGDEREPAPARRAIRLSARRERSARPASTVRRRRERGCARDRSRARRLEPALRDAAASGCGATPTANRAAPAAGASERGRGDNEVAAASLERHLGRDSDCPPVARTTRARYSARYARRPRRALPVGPGVVTRVSGRSAVELQGVDRRPDGRASGPGQSDSASRRRARRRPREPGTVARAPVLPRGAAELAVTRRSRLDGERRHRGPSPPASRPVAPLRAGSPHSRPSRRQRSGAP